MGKSLEESEAYKEGKRKALKMAIPLYLATGALMAMTAASIEQALDGCERGAPKTETVLPDQRHEIGPYTLKTETVITHSCGGAHIKEFTASTLIGDNYYARNTTLKQDFDGDGEWDSIHRDSHSTYEMPDGTTQDSNSWLTIKRPPILIPLVNEGSLRRRGHGSWL